MEVAKKTNNRRRRRRRGNSNKKQYGNNPDSKDFRSFNRWKSKGDNSTNFKRKPDYPQKKFDEGKKSESKSTGFSWADRVKLPPTKPVVKRRTKTNDVKKEVDKVQVSESDETNDKFKLHTNWVLWVHDNNSKDWSVESYKKITTLSTVESFWRIFKNFHALGIKYRHIYLMREGVTPTWEDENNRNGGICTIKIQMIDAKKVITELAMRVFGETFVSDMDDITGISISPKNMWAILRIWNRDAKNDLSTMLPKDMDSELKDLSIKYKANKPEW